MNTMVSPDNSWKVAMTFRKRMLLMASAFLLSAFSDGAVGQAPSRPAPARTQGAAIRIQVLNGKGAVYGQASGFPISGKGWVVTNWHVLRDANEATVETENGVKKKVLGLLAVDAENDLAVLAVDGADGLAGFIVRSDPPAKLGEGVAVSGYPGVEKAAPRRTCQGKVREARSLTPLGQPWMQISCEGLESGSSGSPVLDQSGRVVGVVSAILRSNRNSHFVVPASALASILQKAERSSQQPRPLPPPLDGVMAEPQVQAVVDLIKDGQAGQAAGGIADLKRKYPDSYVPSLLEGHAFDALGQLQKAFSAYEKAAKKNPKLAEAWLSAGTTLCKIGKLKEGIEHLKAASSLEPACANIWFNLGVAFGKTDTPSDSIQYYEKAVELAPEEAGSWFNLCAEYINAGQKAKAMAAFQRLQELDAKSAARLKDYLPK